MRKEDSPTTKLKILEAAKKLFAEKGFDGARVDDIAENAGVNKALIYYYFKSKRDILEELVNGLIEELIKLSYGVIEDGVFDFELKGDVQSEMETFFNFLDGRRDIIKIMMMESLKESEEKPSLFSVEKTRQEYLKKVRNIYYKKIRITHYANNLIPHRYEDFHRHFFRLFPEIAKSYSMRRFFRHTYKRIYKKLIPIFREEIKHHRTFLKLASKLQEDFLPLHEKAKAENKRIASTRLKCRSIFGL